MLTRLDHIALVVHDLQAATAHYSALLGCAPNWHGADDGVEQVWFQLANMALDIISPCGPGSTGDRVRTQLDKHGEGLWAIAFATPDLAKERHALARRGIPSTGAASITSTQVGGDEKRDWTISLLSADATHGTIILLVEQTLAAMPWPLSSYDVSAPMIGLDHVVITTAQPERAAALYGARLDLEMKLDRTNPEWGARLMFFKCGDLIVEIAHNLKSTDAGVPDRTWGLSWRTRDVTAAHQRLTQSGFNVSAVRPGRKPGTQVFTVRDKNANVPTLVIGTSA